MNTKPMNTKFLTARYTVIQIAYWGFYCALNGYAAVFLEGKGFSAGDTGMLLAIGNILAAFLQPVVAAKADKSGRISLKELLIGIGIVSMLGVLALCVTGNNFWMVCGLFLIATVFMQSLQPLLNAVGMYYVNRGENMNFGLARGLGSVGYAGISYLVGILSQAFGSNVIPFVSLVLCVPLLCVVFSLQIRRAGERCEQEDAEGIDAAAKRSGRGSANTAIRSDANFFQLLAKHRDFAAVLVGIVFLFIFHFMQNTYMFQMMQAVGGNSQSMGTAMFLAAMTEIIAMVGFHYFVEKVNIERILRIAGVLWTVKAVAFCFCTSVSGIYAVQLMQMVSYGLYVPASVYYANKVMDEGHKVQGQAMVTVAFTIGSVFGNLLGGKLIDWYGVQMMLMVGVGCAAVGAVFFFVGTKKRPEVRKVNC